MKPAAPITITERDAELVGQMAYRAAFTPNLPARDLDAMQALENRMWSALEADREPGDIADDAAGDPDLSAARTTAAG